MPAVEMSRLATTNSVGSATSSGSVDHSKVKRTSGGVMATVSVLVRMAPLMLDGRVSRLHGIKMDPKYTCH